MNMIGHQAVADQHTSCNARFSRSKSKYTGGPHRSPEENDDHCPLGHMVRYSNGYHSGQASHNSNSSKKMLNEVILRFGLPSDSPITKASGELPVRPPVPPGRTLFIPISPCI